MSVISATGAEGLSLDFQPVAKTGAALFLSKTPAPWTRMMTGATAEHQAASCSSVAWISQTRTIFVRGGLGRAVEFSDQE
jgi:hypothetical protein